MKTKLYRRALREHIPIYAISQIDIPLCQSFQTLLFRSAPCSTNLIMQEYLLYNVTAIVK